MVVSRLSSHMVLLAGTDPGDHYCWKERLPIRCLVVGQQVVLVRLSSLSFGKQTGIIVHQVPHHIVGCPGELMAHRLDGHDLVRPGHLSLIVAPYCLMEPPGKLGSLDV